MHCFESVFLGSLTVPLVFWVCCGVWKVCVFIVWFFIQFFLYYQCLLHITCSLRHDDIRLLFIIQLLLFFVGKGKMKHWCLVHRSCTNSPRASLSPIRTHFWVFLTGDILSASLLILLLIKAYGHIIQSHCTFPSLGVIFLLCHRFLLCLFFDSVFCFPFSFPAFEIPVKL